MDLDRSVTRTFLWLTIIVSALMLGAIWFWNDSARGVQRELWASARKRVEASDGSLILLHSPPVPAAAHSQEVPSQKRGWFDFLKRWNSETRKGKEPVEEQPTPSVAVRPLTLSTASDEESPPDEFEKLVWKHAPLTSIDSGDMIELRSAHSGPYVAEVLETMRDDQGALWMLRVSSTDAPFIRKLITTRPKSLKVRVMKDD